MVLCLTDCQGDPKALQLFERFWEEFELLVPQDKPAFMVIGVPGGVLSHTQSGCAASSAM
jgi:hypothetical protein